MLLLWLKRLAKARELDRCRAPLIGWLETYNLGNAMRLGLREWIYVVRPKRVAEASIRNLASDGFSGEAFKGVKLENTPPPIFLNLQPLILHCT
ncbi:hypothetical protein GJ744_005277 [Endocarpon pusillum]|uniref:Uncharacterized protein n=1 Tax=Endocarpon pusillum TaxID=364733 RepID=A0A8H7A789_9EURO|nr:hypothetical protein GJ744_005277 [Endocarpon pusillum]